MKYFLTKSSIKREYNKKLFAIVAPRYNLVTKILSFGFDSLWKKQMIRALPEIKGIAVDIASGNADIAVLLRNQFPELSIIGTDLSRDMLNLAVVKRDTYRISLMLHDMNSLGFCSDSVDLISGSYALRNAPDLELTLREIHRILKPGTTACFLDFSRSPIPFISFVQLFLIKFWGSLWGLILHGKPSVYGYLADSLSAYPNRNDLHTLFEKVGFSLLYKKVKMFGMIETLVVNKVER